MKKSILSFLLLFILTKSFSQDLIVTSENDSINCLIEYTSNKRIAFKILNNKKEFEKRFIRIEFVKNYKYDYYPELKFNTNLPVDTTTNKANNSNSPKNYDMNSIGLGLGLDYGGIGINLQAYLIKYIGIFGGVGFAGYKPSYNAGFKLRFNPEPENSSWVPYFTGMYGYNTVFVVKNITNYNKIFFGPSVGFGVDIRPSNNKKSFWSVQLIYPIRSKEATDYLNYLQNNSNIKMNSTLLPITLSIGYRGF